MKVTQSCPTLRDLMDYTVHTILQARIVEWVAFSLLQGIFPTQGSNPGLTQMDSLPDEPQGKPKNTGVGSLSLLQCIFLTHESNQGVLHCRQILYQLSYQGTEMLTNNALHQIHHDSKKYIQNFLILSTLILILYSFQNKTYLLA